MADNWWGNWIHQNVAKAKAKSAKAVELLKCDLAEFKQVIQNDTVSTIAATALAFKEKLNVEESSEGCHRVSKGLSSFFGAISEAFTPAVEEPHPPHVSTVKDIPLKIGDSYDGVKVRLCNLQADPATYCAKPDEQYDVWLSGFNLESEKLTISNLLVDRTEIRDLYTKLVPSEVAHNDFWCRYFYRVHQLHQEEARRTALKERAEQTVNSEDLKWDDEDEFDTSSINVGAEDRNCRNLETEDMHNSLKPRGTSEKSEPGLGITTASLPEGTLREPQQPAKLSVADSERIKCKTFVGEARKMSEPLLEVERTQGCESFSKEEGMQNEMLECKCTDLAASDSAEHPPSSSNPRTVENMHSLSDIGQYSKLQFDYNVKESTLAKDSVVEDNVLDAVAGGMEWKVTSWENVAEAKKLRKWNSIFTGDRMGRESTANSVENWDEDLDLDMTEEEIQMTLSRAEDLGELEIEEWEDWVCEQK